MKRKKGLLAIVAVVAIPLGWLWIKAKPKPGPEPWPPLDTTKVQVTDLSYIQPPPFLAGRFQQVRATIANPTEETMSYGVEYFLAGRGWGKIPRTLLPFGETDDLLWAGNLPVQLGSYENVVCVTDEGAGLSLGCALFENIIVEG